jgi:hypothetical protein
MPRQSIYYCTAELFVCLEEIAEQGGLKGRLARFLYAFMFPAGQKVIDEELMYDIRLKGRKILEEL